MSQKKYVRTYYQPKHASEKATWKSMPDQPRDCCKCGRPIRISRDNVWFQVSPVRKTWHLGGCS